MRKILLKIFIRPDLNGRRSVYPFWIILAISYAPFCFAQVSPERLIVADFDNGSMTNRLNGSSGAWNLDTNPRDKTCSVSLDANTRIGDEGYSLKLRYNVDSPFAEKVVSGFWTALNNLDASNFDHLELYVKGDSRQGYPTAFKIEIKKFVDKETGETQSASYIIDNLTGEWQKFSIPLNKMTGIADWKNLEEFVVVFQNRRLDKKIGVVYLDNIAFVKTGDPGPSQFDEVPWPVAKLPKGTKLSSLEYAKFQIGRLTGFPKKLYLRKSFLGDDKELLREIARDTWRYFENTVDKDSGLPLDYIEFSKNSTLGKDTRIGDYTNVTDIGVYLMCIISAYDMGFINKDKAVSLINKTLDTLEKLETYNGYYYNYYDTMMLFRTTHFISLVDSGWLVAGLIVAKEAFDGEERIAKGCQQLIDKQNLSFFYDPVEGQFHHGLWDNLNVFSEHHYGAFYSESRISSVIALGKGEVPLEHWFMVYRTMPESWRWQSQIPKNRIKKESDGYSFYGGYYEYKGIKLVPSWGGSMFEALMPTLALDEKNLARGGLGLNDLNHILAQIKFAKEDENLPVWGFSPCANPEGGYAEYGAKPCGIKPYKATVVTPHASFLALEFAPDEAIRNIKKLIKRYKIYGEYGFYDAVDPKGKKVALKYMCLDQAMILIAINNYLNNNPIKKYFHKSPYLKSAERFLSGEKLFE
jgi:hypothetical protein